MKWEVYGRPIVLIVSVRQHAQRDTASCDELNTRGAPVVISSPDNRVRQWEWLYADVQERVNVIPPENGEHVWVGAERHNSLCRITETIHRNDPDEVVCQYWSDE